MDFFRLLLPAGWLLVAAAVIMSDHTVPPALYNEAATERQQSLSKLLFFVTGTDGALCVCVSEWAVIPVDLESRNENLIHDVKERCNRMLRRGRGDNSHDTQTSSAWHLKSNHAATARTTTAAARTPGMGVCANAHQATQ